MRNEFRIQFPSNQNVLHAHLRVSILIQESSPARLGVINLEMLILWRSTRSLLWSSLPMALCFQKKYRRNVLIQKTDTWQKGDSLLEHLLSFCEVLREVLQIAESCSSISEKFLVCNGKSCFILWILSQHHCTGSQKLLLKHMYLLRSRMRFSCQNVFASSKLQRLII